MGNHVGDGWRYLKGDGKQRREANVNENEGAANCKKAQQNDAVTSLVATSSRPLLFA